MIVVLMPGSTRQERTLTERGSVATETDDRAGVARQIVDNSSYLTLATADADGRPWATPVWFTHDRYTDFLWVSRPDTRHSRNIAARPETAIVIFDSSAPVGTGQGVYLDARAEQVPDAEVEPALAIFSAPHEAAGRAAWRLSDVTGPAQFRLYRARALRHELLDKHDHRVRVDLGP